MKRIIYHWNNFILNYLDKEIKKIKVIVRDIPLNLKKENRYNSLMEECDSVFSDRVEKNPIVLKLDFGKNTLN